MGVWTAANLAAVGRMGVESPSLAGPFHHAPAAHASSFYFVGGGTQAVPRVARNAGGVHPVVHVQGGRPVVDSPALWGPTGWASPFSCVTCAFRGGAGNGATTRPFLAHLCGREFRPGSTRVKHSGPGLRAAALPGQRAEPPHGRHRVVEHGVQTARRAGPACPRPARGRGALALLIAAGLGTYQPDGGLFVAHETFSVS